MQTFNHYLFSLINASPDAASWQISLNIFVAKKLIYLIPLLLVVTWVLGNYKHRKIAIHAFLLTAIALLINQIIGMIIPTQRPFMMEMGTALLGHAPTPSFPSNHLTIFMCITLAYYYGGLRHISYILGVIGLLVAWSRIYVGVHFPLDMIGAVIISGVIFVSSLPLWRAIGESISHALDNIYKSIFRLAK